MKCMNGYGNFLFVFITQTSKLSWVQMGFKAISPFFLEVLSWFSIEKVEQMVEKSAYHCNIMFSYLRSTDWGGWEGWRGLRCFVWRYWRRVLILERREVIVSWISTLIYWYICYCKNLEVFVSLSTVLLMFQPFTVHLMVIWCIRIISRSVMKFAP